MQPPRSTHGANVFCITAEGDVVLISNDGSRWGWPRGRPEEGESWRETLCREILEEPEQGLELVRSIWLARVVLMPWQPCFEIRYRRVVPASNLLANLYMEPGSEPLYYRALLEA